MVQNIDRRIGQVHDMPAMIEDLHDEGIPRTLAMVPLQGETQLVIASAGYEVHAMVVPIQGAVEELAPLLQEYRFHGVPTISYYHSQAHEADPSYQGGVLQCMRCSARQALHMAAMETLSRYFVNRMAANFVHNQPLTEAVANAIVEAPIADCDEPDEVTELGAATAADATASAIEVEEVDYDGDGS